MAAGPQIVAKFVADTSKLTSEVDSATSHASGRMSSFAKGAALAIGGAFAVTKIVEFGKAAVNAAADDAAAQEKLAQSLKNTTGATDAQIAAAEDYISTLSKSAAISDDELRPALATLALGFKDQEEAQKALALATDVSAGTGKDLATVTQAMMKAAQGNTGALKKMGVEVKNADGSAKSLDQIMADMAKTFEGQAAVAAGSTAGQMKLAQIQFAEMQETIGAKLLPVVAAFATFLVDTLFPAIGTVINFITDHQDVWIALGIGIAGVGTIIVVSLIPAFIAWATAAGAAAIATLAAAAPFIAIGAVIAGVAYLIIKNWDTIVRVTKETWDKVLGFVKAVWDWIKNNWPLLLTILTGPFGAAVWAIKANWDSIKAAAVAVYNWLRDAWAAVKEFVVAPIRDAWTAISGFFGQIRGAATETYDWIKSKFDAIAGAINSVVGSVRSAAESVANAIKAPINAVIGAWNGLAFEIPRIELPSVEIMGKKIGGQGFGPYTFDFPNIPGLARGGVLTSPTLFVGGEAGTEIVSPEALLRQIMREEGRGGSYTLIMQPRTADAADVAYGFRRLELMAGA